MPRLRDALLVATLLVGVAPGVALAQCPAINPNDWTADDAGLQCLLDAGGTISLAPGNPGYIVNSGLFVKINGTKLVSSAAPSQRATIIAGPDLHAWMLITPPYPVHNVEISYISFEGMTDNGGYRWNRYCLAPDNTPGNIAIWGDGTYIHDSESKHALCGSGMLVFGSNFHVINNYVAYNGRDRYSGEGGHPWSDGITSLVCNSGEIAYNVVVDNTDVGIVTGGGACSVHDNYIWNGGKYAFAGIHVGWFQEGGGNHSGAVFENNTIQGASDGQLGMGIAIGFHMWNSNVGISSPTVRNNTISGAVINLMVDGVSGASVTGNSIGAASASGGDAGPSDTCMFGTGVQYGLSSHASGSFQGGATNLMFDSGTCTFF